MERLLTGFIDHLRQSGIPVSMVEAIDAARGLEHIDLGSRSALRALLGATLIKTDRHLPTFDVAFDAYFSLLGPDPDSAEDLDRAQAAWDRIADSIGRPDASASGDADLIAALLRGLRSDDRELVQAVARTAVDRFAGIEPGRPVGGAYYLYRVMQALELGRVRIELAGEMQLVSSPGLEDRLRADAIERQIEELREMVREEIRRRLVQDRGAAAVTRTLRRPLVEDLDLTSATREELAQIERIVHPLGRRLATRISQRRNRGNRGRLDVRRTMRIALSTGGTPIDPRFRKKRPGRPEIVLLCDVSGSVATFARFTMQLVYAIAAQFSRVRTFAFIDGIDEVTGVFAPGSDFGGAMDRISREAEVVWLDGHSDYGNAFGSFVDRYLADAVSSRSSVIVTGDARTNYHDPNVAALQAVSQRARGLWWLNPEPRRYWDTGDSVMGQFAPWCDEVVEVRTLRQLERFVEGVALPGARRVPIAG